MEAPDQAAHDTRPPRTGLEYFEDDAGGHRFRIRAANGEPVATSESYTRPEDAERGFGDLVGAISAALAIPPVKATGLQRDRIAIYANSALSAIASGADMDDAAEERVALTAISAALSLVLSIEGNIAAIASVLEDRLPGERA